jgi:hypothetical protein
MQSPDRVEKIDFGVDDLEIREVVRDPDNFIAEAGIDARGQHVALVYSRYRGMRHSDDGSILFASSHDGGRSWSEPADTVCLEQFETWGFTSPGVKILADGSILAIAHANAIAGEPTGRTSRFRGAFMARSQDEGKSWSRPEPISAWPMRHINIWDSPLELDDGALLLAVSGTTENAAIHGSYAESSRSALLRSDDGGRRWYSYGTIAHDPAGIHTFYEPGIACAADGALVALSRQHYELQGSSPPGGCLFVTRSEDGGASWSGFHKTGLWGYPADVVTLPGGHLLCAYGYRRDPLSIKVALSRDGVAWSERNAREIYRPPAVAPGEGHPSAGLDAGYRHIGYPSAVVLETGKLLVAFHSFDASSRKQIVLLASFVVRT